MKSILKIVTSFVLTIFVISCNGTNENSSTKQVTFKDLVNIEDISKISVHNNNGEHVLNGQDKEELLAIIANMTFEKNGSYKLGAKAIVLTINGKSHTLLGSTHGNHLEVSSDIVTKNKDNIGVTSNNNHTQSGTSEPTFGNKKQ